jgi:hypothetical protein
MKNVRLEATKYIWTAFAVVLGLMFGTSWFGEFELGAGHIVLGIVISVAAFLSTGAVWNWGTLKFDNETIMDDTASSSEKAKRGYSLSHLLDQMSDDELLDLREELRRHKYSDGELIR